MKSLWKFLLIGCIALTTLTACTPKEEEAVGNATENAAGSVSNAAEETGETVSNAGVTAKIKNAINLSPKIKNLASTINVNTTDTEVKLEGTVATEDDKMEAENLAKANAGDRTVNNMLTVSP